MDGGGRHDAVRCSLETNIHQSETGQMTPGLHHCLFDRGGIGANLQPHVGKHDGQQLGNQELVFHQENAIA